LTSLSFSAAVFGLLAVLLLAAANGLFSQVFPRHPRLAYAIIVVFLCGTAVPAIALQMFSTAGLLGPAVLAPAFLPIGAAVVAGGGFLALSIRDEPAEQWLRLPKLLVALFAPSLAEVLVFAGIVFTLAQFVLARFAAPVVTAILATVATSLAFGLYHLTHAAPWNSLRMVRILFVVWLFIAGFYALTHNLWATALLNTLLAAIGFVKNRATRPEELSLATSLLLDLAGIAATLSL
jgi:hypothetical protein